LITKSKSSISTFSGAGKDPAFQRHLNLMLNAQERGKRLTLKRKTNINYQSSVDIENQSLNIKNL
jgi:hypothetical protein